MVARFQDGWLHVIWKWNKSICAWEYGIRVGWVGKSTNQGWGCGSDGVWRGRGGGVYCLLEVPEGCNCQVNVLQCTLKGVETGVGKYTRRKYGLLFVEKTVFVVVVGGSYLSVFVWVVGSCLAVSEHEVLVGIDD